LLKCKWAVQETDWVGYWLSLQGRKPWKKKIEVVLLMQPPSNVKQVCSFIGAVSFYRDMYPHCSHLLAPLTNLTNKGAFVWAHEHQQDFNVMKALIAQDCMLRYPDHNKSFHIYHTNTSNYQLGTILVQEGIPVTFYSRKLTDAQKKYTTLEKELLGSFMTCKEYATLLLGDQIIIHTNHKNLTYTPSVNQHVLHQLNYVKRFGLKHVHISGDDNMFADMFSHIDRLLSQMVSPLKRESSVNNFSFLLDDEELLKCFLKLPDADNIPFALDLTCIAQGQQQDQELWQ
jgi:hypothetical protein